jgi:hypothetical protein
MREVWGGNYKEKVLLVLDREKYRWQKFISDLAGQDPVCHENRPEKMITHVRNWLVENGRNKKLPGGDYVFGQFKLFQQDLPQIRRSLKFDERLCFPDYFTTVRTWLNEMSL